MFKESPLITRYVGVLHEIDSENSTVSLEQVRSYGTEGRKGDPSLEISASDNVFEYIVFRGSDVKDLRVEQPKAPAPKPAQNPAIIQVCYHDRVMKNTGCTTPRAQNRVEISVAFLLTILFIELY